MLTHFEIKNFESTEFQEISKLYENTFLPVERIPMKQIRTMLKEDNNYHMYITKMRDAVVGFSLLYIFSELKVGFLVYMAVSDKYRKKGIGSQIFNHVYDECKMKIDKPLGLLMEIQRIDSKNNNEVIKRRKRILFYKKLGVLLLKNVNHYLIPQHGQPEPELVYLMMKPYDEVHLFTKKQVLSFIESIYKKIYRDFNKDIYNKIESNMPSRIYLSNIENTV